MINTGLTQAYKDAGFILGNPRNQWSAIDEERPAVALTIWADQIDKSSLPGVFDAATGRSPAIWMDRPGNTVRKRHILFGFEKCGGKFEVILLHAVNPTEDPRVVKSARWWNQVYGVIQREDFDPETGVFKMTLLPRSKD